MGLTPRRVFLDCTISHVCPNGAIFQFNTLITLQYTEVVPTLDVWRGLGPALGHFLDAHPDEHICGTAWGSHGLLVRHPSRQVHLVHNLGLRPPVRMGDEVIWVHTHPYNHLSCGWPGLIAVCSGGGTSRSLEAALLEGPGLDCSRITASWCHLIPPECKEESLGTYHFSFWRTVDFSFTDALRSVLCLGKDQYEGLSRDHFTKWRLF